MGSRIGFEEGISLFAHGDLEELCARAEVIRFEKNPRKEVTFVLDSNPNYTNQCSADCSFCAFYRKPSAKDVYTKSVEECLEHFAIARKAGVSTVMMQGGLHDELPLDFYTELIQRARQEYPDIFPHCFTAPEIWNIARVHNLSIREVLQHLYRAGLRTLPGGGAEILSERVRQKISPKKMDEDVWIDVHKTAHSLGYRTTATMMYGHVEEPYDVVLHLETLRQAQDQNPGFTAFIPWSYKRDRTALRRSVLHWAGPDAYLRMIAFSRIYLDNFDHIQGSWFSEGKEVGIRALQSGADDFGGICLEENVHKATGFVHKVHHNHVLEMIRQAGFTPVERNPLYDRLKVYAEGEWAQVPDLQKEMTQNKDRLVILGQHASTSGT